MARTAYRYYRLQFSKSSAGNNRYYAIDDFALYGIEGSTTNLCVGATATASGQYSGDTVPQNAIDGSLSTYWESALMGSPSWLQVDLGEPVFLLGFSIRSVAYSGEKPVDFKLLGSSDGSAWDELASYTAFASHSGEFVLLGYGIKGISTLEDGSAATEVVVLRWSDMSLLARIAPANDGSWQYTTRDTTLDTALVIHIGPSGFRPLSDGPITIGDILE